MNLNYTSILIFTVVLLFVNFVTSQNEDNLKIMGGTNANSTLSKHMVSLRMKATENIIFGSSNFCSGTLITRSMVLTSATCLYQRPIGDILVVAGDVTLSTNNTQIFKSGVKQIIPHENYTYGTESAVLFNIGILKLLIPVPDDHPTISPIDYRTNSAVNVSTTCSVSGWGIGTNWTAIQRLRSIDMTIEELSNCNASFSNTLNPIDMLCAKPINGTLCFGDEGSPIICDNLLTGVASFGDTFCEINSHYIFSNVYNLHDWIDTQMNNDAHLIKINLYVLFLIVASTLFFFT